MSKTAKITASQINKLICQAMGSGYDGDPQRTSLTDIQEWIITECEVVPCVHWNSDNKKWKAYVYPLDFCMVKAFDTLKKKYPDMTNSELKTAFNKWVRKSYTMKAIENGSDDDENTYLFDSPTTALYTAIKAALDNIGILMYPKKSKLEKYVKDLDISEMTHRSEIADLMSMYEKYNDELLKTVGVKKYTLDI